MQHQRMVHRSKLLVQRSARSPQEARQKLQVSLLSSPASNFFIYFFLERKIGRPSLVKVVSPLSEEAAAAAAKALSVNVSSFKHSIFAHGSSAKISMVMSTGILTSQALGEIVELLGISPGNFLSCLLFGSC